MNAQARALRAAFNQVTYEDRLTRFLARLYIGHTVEKFTGCAWMTPRGVVYPVRYCGHADFA